MKKRFQRWIDCLKSNTKNLLKQRLDFPFGNNIETTDRLAKMHGQKLLKQQLDFPFEKEIHTMDTLSKI